MPFEVIMPALGLAQETGKVVRWLKGTGDHVGAGEPIVEIETDKVTVELEADADGYIGALSAGEGDDVPVGAVIALVYETAEECRPAVPAVAGAPRSGPEPAPDRSPVAAPAPPPNGSALRPLASPKARRFAAAHGVDLGTLRGTGPRGAVRATDVVAAVDAGRTSPDGGGEAGFEPHSRIWSRMAERLSESWREAPHFFLQREVDASGMLRWKDACNSRATVAVTLTDVLVAVSARVVARHPRVRSQWAPAGLRTPPSVDIGIAVAIDEGLVVPVIRSADARSIDELARERAGLVERARAGQLAPADVGGGVFTVSNLGMFGVDAFRAILNPPEAAILAVGRVRTALRLASGAPAEYPVLTLTLSCDHRVVDGAVAARFLGELAEALENPLVLLD